MYLDSCSVSFCIHPSDPVQNIYICPTKKIRWVYSLLTKGLSRCDKHQRWQCQIVPLPREFSKRFKQRSFSVFRWKVTDKRYRPPFWPPFYWLLVLLNTYLTLVYLLSSILLLLHARFPSPISLVTIVRSSRTKGADLF